MGFMGKIQGVDVITSQDVPAGSAFLIATDPLSYPSGQHTPVGYFVESRPIETLTQYWQFKDSYEVYMVHEYTTVITYGEGIVQITYTATS